MTTTNEKARAEFERQANDSYGFKRSRRGTYQNPAVARDWKWFRAGLAFAAKSDLERDFPPRGGLTECDMGDSYE